MNTPEVRLVSNGSYWQAQWYDQHGRRRGRSLGPKAKISERQARRKAAALAAEMARKPAMASPGEPMPLAAWMDRYLSLKTDYSESTAAEYRYTKAYLVRHFGPDKRIDRIAPADVADFRAFLSKQGCGEQTVRKHLRNCKAAFQVAEHERRIFENPFVGQATAPLDVDGDWRYVDQAELDTILESCPDTKWKALLALLRLSALRLSEARRLQWQHVDFEKRKITVVHKGRRSTKKRKREIPIQPRLNEVLLERFAEAEEGDAYVVGLGVDRNIRFAFQNILKRAEVDEWEKLFHTLRKNCESDWLSRYPVMDVCAWLGHSPTVAAKHYHQTTSETFERAVRGTTELDELRAERDRLAARVEELEQQLQEAQK